MKQQGEVFSFKTGEGEGQRVYTYPLQEVKELAVQLGMDLDVDRDFLWFLKEALVTILPLGWRKEENTTGLAQYHNTLTGVTTETHPLLYIFRSAFSHLLEMYCNQRPDLAAVQDTGQNSRQRRLEPDLMISLQSAEDQQVFFSELLKKIEKKQEGMKDTAKFEAAMKEVDMFYSALIVGGKVPRSIEDTLEYQCVDPKKMLELAKILGVQDDYRLFWVARVFAVLPLPPLWKRSYDTFRNEVYLNARYSITLRYHPSKNFFYKFIQTLRFGTLHTTSPVMTFLDKKLRVYEVDLLRLALGQEYVLRVSDQPALHFRRQSKFFRSRATGMEMLDDVMALEIAEGAGVDLAAELHLLGVVYGFFDLMKSHLKGWEFRYTVQGGKYWYHPATQKAAKTYPFRHKLKATVDQARTAYYRGLQQAIKDKEEIHPAFRASKRDPLPMIREEAALLMAVHVGSYFGKGKVEIQDAGAAAKWLPFRPATTIELMDVLFACPFRFDEDVSVFHPNFDINSEDEFIDVIEQDEVCTALEDLKRPEVPKSKPKPKLHGLMSKPHAAHSSGSKGVESAAGLVEDQGTGKAGAGKDIKELVTQRALEAVHRLREAHNVSIQEEDSRADQTSEDNSLVSLHPLPIQPHPPVVQFTPLPVASTPDPLLLLGNISPSAKSPLRKSLAFPEKPTEEDKRSTRRSVEGSARGLEPGSLKSKDLQGNAPSRPFKIAFARSPKFKNTLMGEIRGKAVKTQDLETTTKTVRTQEREDTRKSVVSPGPDLTEKSAQLQDLLTGSDKDISGRSRAVDSWPAAFPARTQDRPGEFAGLTPLPSDGDVRQESTEEEADLQQTLKLLLAQSLVQQRRGSLLVVSPGLRTETVGSGEGDAEFPVDYQALLTSLMQDHPDLLTNGQTEQQLERLLEQAMGSSGLAQKPNGRTQSELEVRTTGLFGSTTATRVSSRTLQSSASPSALRSNALSTVASPRISRNSSVTDRVAHKEGLGRRILPALNSPGPESELDPPRAATEMRLSHRKPSFGGLRSYDRYQPPSKSPEGQFYRTDSATPTALVSPGRLSKAALHMSRTPEDYLKHYVSVLGSPFDVFDLSSFPTIAGLQPCDVVQMGKRLEIRVTVQPFESVESDLLWVGYLQMLAPLPPAFPVRSIEGVLALPAGRHPGDSYFKLMLEHQRLKRKKELKSMLAGKRVRSMVEQSWLRLRAETGKCYRYNFLTGEQGPDSTLEYVRFKPQTVMHRRTVSLALPLPKSKKMQKVR